MTARTANQDPKPSAAPRMGKMSAFERVMLAAAVAIMLIGLVHVGQVLAQTPTQDLQRQIDRLQTQLDTLPALRERIAAAEREIALTRQVIWGTVSMLVANFIVSSMTLRRVSRCSGPPGEVD